MKHTKKSKQVSKYKIPGIQSAGNISFWKRDTITIQLIVLFCIFGKQKVKKIAQRRNENRFS